MMLIQPAVQQNRSPSKPNLKVSLAIHPSEVQEAQRLRYKVFAEEMGAKIAGNNGLDIDGFDAFCDHLLVRDTNTQQVIGTYRILSPTQANEAGSYYSSGEFDLSRINHLLGNTVEVGRACVHRDYRSGGTITLLWAGLAKYMRSHGYQHMIGCASIPMNDGGHAAASIYHHLKDKHLCPPEYRVFPHVHLPIESLNNTMQVDCPPLIKGYLRLGAKICGEPAWDSYFNTADILVMLSISEINQKYAAHFLR
ncbi:MAG: GNAT family N-acetyltransferase [Methylophilaceae bacterium]|nr:MAG: GNAT family N-acetyltransferase [Methylophilaceae bacterium]